MTLVADNVRVAVTGAIYSGPTDATAPTDADAAWAGTYTDHGYVSEDGIEESYSDDTTEIKAWQGSTVVREVISGSKAQLHFTLIETKFANLELYHKGSVVEETAPSSGKWKMDVLVPGPDRRSFGLDVIDGDELIRIFIREGEVVERGNIVYKGDEAIGYEVTLTAYPVAGVVLTKFSNSDAWDPS